MKQCKTCLDREHKDELICCQANHLSFVFRELLRSIPLIGRHIPKYECKGYERDNTLTGFPTAPQHVNCRCALHYPTEGIDDI